LGRCESWSQCSISWFSQSPWQCSAALSHAHDKTSKVSPARAHANQYHVASTRAVQCRDVPRHLKASGHATEEFYSMQFIEFLHFDCAF
jgi:hypothetical protein